MLDTVGLGSFAKVSRVRRRSTDEVFVWKELSYGVMSNKGKQMLCDEVNILRDLKHPNIVQFVDRIIDHSQRRIYIVQEYCNGGDLASYIVTKKEKVSLHQNNERCIRFCFAAFATFLTGRTHRRDVRVERDVRDRVGAAALPQQP